MDIPRLLDLGDERTCPAAFILKDFKVLVGLRHYTPDKWKAVSVWTVPGGRGDAGETIGATLLREIAEETGITEVEILAYVQDILGAKEGDIVPVFLCETTQDPTLMEPEKFSEWRWVPLHEFAAGAPGDFINPDARTLILDFIAACTR
jgi:ADP-ribose pyrophosphatase YjhB (NUDIX family)